MPKTTAILWQSACRLKGLSLQELAHAYHFPLPLQPKQAKGWIGQLLEIALGANAGNQAKPDFMHLGIELKTLPVSVKGDPLETTYVCHASLKPKLYESWQQSTVYQKLRHVLWIPIITDPKQPFAKRTIAQPILWQPTPQQLQILQQDWQELTDMIAMGDIEQINAEIGEYLHIRPKGANAQSLTTSHNASGEPILTLPRGFYLRSSLTKQILCAIF